MIKKRFLHHTGGPARFLRFALLLVVMSCLSLSVCAAPAEDPNFILVEKTFSGLPEALIPEGFQVTVTSPTGTTALDRENTVSRFSDEDGNAVWRWKITGVGTGTYSVTESGEEVENYTVTKSGEGTAEVRPSDMTVLIPVHETTCSHKNWPVKVDGDDNILFAATLTQGGVAVISRSPLSASQRAAVSQAVLKINGPWKTPVYFYSIEEQIQNGVGFELNGATITYDKAKEEVIIGRTRNWQHVATLRYSLSEAENPEIALKNTYVPSTAKVVIQKTVAGNMADREKRFSFSVSVRKDGADSSFTVDGTPYTGSMAFTLKDGESMIVEDIPVGAEFTVTEEDYAGYGYRTSVKIDQNGAESGRTAFLPITAKEDHTILFTNCKEAVPDTGVRLDSPLCLLLPAAAGIFLLCRRRRNAKEERS